MAQSFSTDDRSKYHRESPLFWLYLLAASLTMHLAILLIGRWYLMQPSRLQAAGVSSGSVEFVEIDPNATVVESPKPTLPPKPSATTVTSPQSAPSVANSPAELPPNSTSVIENLAQRFLPDSPKPRTSLSPTPQQSRIPKSSPSPASKTQQSQQSQRGVADRPSPNEQEPANSSTPQEQEKRPSSPTESPSPASDDTLENSTNRGSSSSQSSDNPNSGQPLSKPNSNQPNSPPSEPSPSNDTPASQTPVKSNQPLSRDQQFQTKIIGQLTPTNSGYQTSSQSARLKGDIPPITLELPSALSSQVVTAKVILVINNQNGTVADVLPQDEPTRKLPQWTIIQGIVYQAMQQNEVTFEVEVENPAGTIAAPESPWNATVQIRVVK